MHPVCGSYTLLWPYDGLAPPVVRSLALHFLVTDRSWKERKKNFKATLSVREKSPIGLLSKVLYGSEALPRGHTPYPFICQFKQKRCPGPICISYILSLLTAVKLMHCLLKGQGVKPFKPFHSKWWPKSNKFNKIPNFTMKKPGKKMMSEISYDPKTNHKT